jgi:hypothetical protein
MKVAEHPVACVKVVDAIPGSDHLGGRIATWHEAWHGASDVLSASDRDVAEVQRHRPHL